MVTEMLCKFPLPKMNKTKNKKRDENFYLWVFHSVTPEWCFLRLMPPLINESKLIYT